MGVRQMGEVSMKAVLELEMYRGDGGAGEKGQGGAVGEKVNVKGLKRSETKQDSEQSLPVN